MRQVDPRRTALLAFSALGVAAALAQNPTPGSERPLSRADQASEGRELKPLGPAPTPANNPTTPEKVALGKRLFFDPLLSGSNKTSCASCHRPDHGFADVRRLSPGDGGKALARHTPTLINVAYNLTQFWDGRADSLEAQALQPIENPAEMDQRIDALLPELRSAGYGTAFAKAFGEEGLTRTTLAKALAAYERTLTQTDAPFDRWMRGDEKAMSYAAVRGLLVFTTKGRCVACHSGPNFTNAAHNFGNAFMNIGVKPVPGDAEDVGRSGAIVSEAERRKIFDGAFKVPSLRGVGHTAPYMHNGSLATLEEVVEFYMRGGDAGKLRPARLTPAEKDYLVAFLREGLTSP